MSGRLILFGLDADGNIAVVAPGWGGEGVVNAGEWLAVPTRSSASGEPVKRLEFTAPSVESIVAVVVSQSDWEKLEESLRAQMTRSWPPQHIVVLRPGQGDGSGAAYRFVRALVSGPASVRVGVANYRIER